MPLPTDSRKAAAQRGGDQDHQDRRKELAEFLRSRRARVKPPETSLVPPSRRRTPGLRREEVAEMTGVSASWYTWLEQGRDIRPSPELLTRLARALGLDAFETRHLFHLAAQDPPAGPGPEPERVPEGLDRLVSEVLQVPAFVLGERQDFLLWNRQFAEQVLDLEKLPRERRTWLDVVFHEPSRPRARADWQETARRAVAEFRGTVGKQIGNPWVRDLVARISRENPDFARLWKSHDVQERGKSRVLETQYGKRGKRTYLRSIYIPAEAEHLRLVILTPVTAPRART